MVYDYAIFGGGVIGASILNKLTRLNKKCVLLEIGSDVSVGTTKANSGLVHAGYDAAPGSLKARFNVEGNAMFDTQCKELGVPFERIGSLVVGNDMHAVKALFDRGQENNVPGLEILNRQQLLKLVPNLKNDVTCGLFAKTAGIISPYNYTVALAEESVLNGAEIIFNFRTVKVDNANGIYNIHSDSGETIKAQGIINSTGCNYNDVAKLIGAETHDVKFRIGEYFLLDASEANFVKHTIFPLPNKSGKGVVITPAIDGKLLIGPTAKNSETYVPETSQDGLKEIREKAEVVIGGIPFRKNIRNFAGVRAIVGDDFVVEKSKLAPNVINLAGICSPGLTAAPAIAKYVATELLGITDDEIKMQHRKPITTIFDKSKEEIAQLITKDKNYGKIVCRCENITLAEILEAINGPLKPKTVDAIKRRTRAGMGRCQGGFCMLKVMSQLAATYNLDITDINKENSGSNIAVGDIKAGGFYE